MVVGWDYAVKKGGLGLLFLLTLDLSSEAGLSQFDELGKSRLIEYCQVSQHLAIDFDRRLLQAIHETAVGQTVAA